MKVRPNGQNHRPTQILLVGDVGDFVDLYRTVPAMGGYEVERVADGQDVLEMIRRSRPDRVLTGVRMPRMSGLDLLRRLRSDPITMDLPTVMLSNDDDPTMDGGGSPAGSGRVDAEGKHDSPRATGVLRERLPTWLDRGLTMLSDSSVYLAAGPPGPNGASNLVERRIREDSRSGS